MVVVVGATERSTPAKTYAAAMCLLKSLERGNTSQNLYSDLGLKALTKSSLHKTRVLILLNGPRKRQYMQNMQNIRNVQNMRLYVYIYIIQKYAKYAIKNMHKICKYMQKYAEGNMQKYAKICNRKYARNMQVYEIICSRKHALICTYVHIC